MHTSPSRWYLFLLAGVLFFFFAIISKKTIWPFVIIIPIAYYFFSDAPIKKILLYSGLLLFLPLFLFHLHKSLDLEITRKFFEHENPFYVSGGNIFSRAPTAFYVMGRYLSLHIFPLHLAYYYGAKYVPIVNWRHPLAWGALLFYLLSVFFVLRYFVCSVFF